MVEIAVEFIEAVIGREEFVAVAEMVLAELARRITERLQGLGDGDVPRLQADGGAGNADLAEAGAQADLAGDEGGAPGRAAVFGMKATPVLFTWPSRAKLTAYEYDKESTNYSRTALEQALRILAQDPSVKDITILAHSMGTWLAMESLRQMGIRDGHVNTKIRDVILASPDIDIQVFAKQFVEMGTPRPKFTIFVSQDDRALAVSSFITGKVSRLGAIDPSKEPYRSRLEEAGITAIDLTKVDTGDKLNHGKFAESPEIVQLIGQRLMTGQTLTDSNITLGEGVAAVVGGTVQTVGKVAGTAVAAPLTIVGQPLPTAAKPVEVEDTLRADPQSQPLTQ